MTDIRWLEDHVPNYIWAGGLVAGDPNRGFFRIVKVLDAICEALASSIEGFEADRLDGGLVGFESVPAAARAAVLDLLRARGISGLAAPDGFVQAIRLYPGAPGSWLAAAAADSTSPPDPEKAERFLQTSIAAIASGRGPGATAVKALLFRQLITAGKLHLAPDPALEDELIRYPGQVSEQERGRVESFLRASFAASRAAADPFERERTEWAVQFWNANGRLYPCLVRDHDEPEGEEPDLEGGEVSEPDAPSGDAFGEEISSVWAAFLEVALATDPGLYDPARHEVLSGLAARGLRTTLAVAAHPGLWVGEFSAPLLRSVSEVVVDLGWFCTPQGREASAPLRFKEFGRGRLKLAKLHNEEFVDRFGANPLIDEILEGLDEEVNREVGEEWQDISLEATFTGSDLRKMAIAADMEWVYKLELGPMSSIVHSEWPTLTRYDMELCVNPVHRLHWLPRQDLTPSVRPMAGQAAVVLAKRVFQEYRRALSPAADAG
jgi:hypothetical protein